MGQIAKPRSELQPGRLCDSGPGTGLKRLVAPFRRDSQVGRLALPSVADRA